MSATELRNAAVLGGALAVVAAAWSTSGCVAPMPLPDELAGMSQGEVTEGADAQRLLAAMHGRPDSVPPRSMVATYFGATGSAVVYLSVYASAGDAAAALGRMRHAIDRGGTPFDPFTGSGDGVLWTVGMGQRHAVWRAGPRLYWVQAPAALVERAVAELRGDDAAT